MVGNSRKPASRPELIAGGTIMLTIGILLVPALFLAERPPGVSMTAIVAGGAIAVFVALSGLGLLLLGLRHKAASRRSERQSAD